MKTYEPQQYWSIKGKEPADPFPIPKKIKILEALSSLKFDSVLELGCGDGQLTKIITDYFKPKRYLAVDLSADRLAKLEIPNIEKKQADILNFETVEKFDLVISSHLLLHIEPHNIKKAIQTMYHYSKKYCVNIDPINFSIPGNWAYYNFPHDYFALWYEIVDSLRFHQIEDKVGLWLIRK